MLRIKRSVQHTYNTQVNMMSAQMLASGGIGGTVADLAPGEKDDMRMLEAKAVEMQQKSSVSFVRGDTQSKAVEEASKEATVNPDEIDLDDDDDDESDEEPAEGGAENGTKRAVGGVEEQAIPSQVFGSLKKDD